MDDITENTENTSGGSNGDIPRKFNIAGGEDLSDNPQLDNQNIQGDNTVKDPDQWTTGGEPMTGAQKSYLKTLSDEAGEELDDTLTKTEASKRIEDLQHKTGRGANNGNVTTGVPN